jgi:hypothetical protein
MRERWEKANERKMEDRERQKEREREVLDR